MSFVSKVQWFINSASQGNRQVRGLQDWGVEDDSSVESVNEVGSDDPAGFKRKPGGITITFTEQMMEGEPLVDWDSLQRTRETFSMTRQAENGRRVQYLDGRVSTFAEKGDADGDNTGEATVIFLRRKVL